jgi:uncharacterized protein GlcG (DUF336 family)
MSKKKKAKKIVLPKHAVYSLTAEDTLALQTAIVEEALKNDKVVALRICNNFEFELAMFFMPGARPFTKDVTKIKGLQTAHTARNTEVVAMATDLYGSGKYIAPEVFGINGRGSVMKWSGGVSIYDKNGNFLGSIAVSNLTGEKDRELATTAIKKCGLKTTP